MTQLLIGCDPELFVKGADGKHVSAYNMIPGNKREPYRVNNGAVQVDGMALEFNIDPASNAETFDNNISVVMDSLRQMVPENLEFDISPVAFFEEEYMASQPLEATELGCEPDFNAYTGTKNPRPNGSVPFRTASGHIHIGWTEGMDPHDPDHFEACCMLTKQLDVFLGLTAPLWDGDIVRRQLYGQLGSFRPKPYGVEYRVLSNAWLKHPELRKVVFSMAKLAFDLLVAQKRLYTNPLINRVIHKNTNLEFTKRYWYELYHEVLAPLPSTPATTKLISATISMYNRDKNNWRE